jgi:cytoskeletal protein CcmA (bactofilin family)
MAKLASTRIYGNLVVDQNISLSGTINDFTLGDISEINKNDNTAHFLRGDGEWITPTNNYLTTASFNSADGVLTLNRNGLTATTVDLDGRYLTSYTESDTLASVTGRGATTATALSITNTTDSSSTTTGSLIVSGGVGIAKNLYVGGDVDLGGKLQVTGDATFSGSIVIDENLSVGGWLNVAGDATFGGSIDIAEDVNIGGSLVVKESIEAGSIETGLSAVQDNKIYLRIDATEAMGLNEFAGLVAKKADGVNDAALLFDGNGNARVGDLGPELEYELTYIDGVDLTLGSITTPTDIDPLSKDIAYLSQTPSNNRVYTPESFTNAAVLFNFSDDYYYYFVSYQLIEGGVLKVWEKLGTSQTFTTDPLNDDFYKDTRTNEFYKKVGSTTEGTLVRYETNDPIYLYASSDLYKYNSSSKSWDDSLGFPKESIGTTAPGSPTAITITNLTADGTLLTATVSSTSGIFSGDILAISSSSTGAINGNWLVHEILSSTQFTFYINISGITPNISGITSTITNKSYADLTEETYIEILPDATKPLVTRSESVNMTNNAFTFWNGASGEKKIETASNISYINNKIGINTITPEADIHVVGNIRTTSLTATNLTADFIYGAIDLISGGSGNQTWKIETTVDDMSFLSGSGSGTERMVLDDSGNLSIQGSLTLDGDGSTEPQTFSSADVVNWGTAYTHSQLTTGNPHGVTATDVGLGNLTNDAQVKKRTSSTSGYVPTWNGTNGDALNDGYSVQTTLSSSTTALVRADAISTALSAKEDTLNTDQKRKITISTSDPSGGSDGDIWIKYTV